MDRQTVRGLVGRWRKHNDFLLYGTFQFKRGRRNKPICSRRRIDNNKHLVGRCARVKTPKINDSIFLLRFGLTGSGGGKTQLSGIRPLDIWKMKIWKLISFLLAYVTKVTVNSLAPESGMWLHITSASTASSNVLNSRWPDELFSPKNT